MINEIMNSGLAQSVGWSLVHFVWQGMAIAILAWLALAITPARNPNLRYAIGCMALMSMMISPFITMGWMAGFQGQNAVANLSDPVSPPLAGFASSNFPDKSVAIAPTHSPKSYSQIGEPDSSLQIATQRSVVAPTWTVRIREWQQSISRSLTPAIPTLTLVWLLGACLLSLKLIFSWYSVQRVKRSGAPVQDASVVKLFGQLKNQLKLSVAIPIQESMAVHSPTVIGWVRPVILLPLASVTGLNQQQLTAILAHELAHIRRADYLVNLFQAVVETLLFYHPAVWWLSRRIRQERENCCDDLAVKICGDKRTYVEALLKLEQARSQSGSLAMASSGGDLIERVARMLEKNNRHSIRSTWLAGLMTAAIVGMLLIGSATGQTAGADPVLQDVDTKTGQESEQDEDKTAKIVLQEGIQVRGKIMDEKGEPITDALIVWGDHPYGQEGSQEVSVHADGSYQTPTQKEGKLRITVIAPGYAPDSTIVDVNSELKETDFVLAPGKRLEIRFVDEEGKPATGVFVGIERWRKVESLYNNIHRNVKQTRIPVNCDDDAVYVWDWAPEDEVTYSFSGQEYLFQRNVTLTASDEPVTIVMKKPKTFAGKVADENGKPIGKFTVTPRLHLNSQITSERNDQLVHGSDGEFSIKLEQQEGEYSLRIDAEGYKTAFTEKFDRDSDPQSFEVVLKPEAAVQYQVVTDDGQPVSNATVIAAPTDQTLSMHNSYFNGFEIKRRLNRKTDSTGTFSFPSSDIPRTLMAISPDYYGEVNDYPENPSTTITAKKWSSLNCVVKKDGQPWHVGYFLKPNRYANKRFYHIQAWQFGDSTGEGNLTVKKVAPIPHVIDFFAKGDPQGLRHQIAFEPIPGEEFKIDFTGATRAFGRVKLLGNNVAKADLERSRFSLVRLEPSVSLPAELENEIREAGLEAGSYREITQWFTDHENFHAVTAYSNCLDSYTGPISKNGEFSTEILQPGKYQLSVTLYAKSPSNVGGEPMSDFSQTIEIGPEPNDLGEFAIQLFDDPEPGSAIADLEFTILSDQSKSTLGKHRGKYVLLDFWAPWCDVCGEDTPKVQRLVNMLAAKGKTAVISLKSNGSGPTVRLPATTPAGIEWIDGQISTADESDARKRLGVWTSQHFVLVDPDGNYVVGGSLPMVVNKMEELGLK